jgi:hypothetical protein
MVDLADTLVATEGSNGKDKMTLFSHSKSNHVKIQDHFCDENVTNKNAMSDLVSKAHPSCVVLNRKSSALSAEDFLLLCRGETKGLTLKDNRGQHQQP